MTPTVKVTSWSALVLSLVLGVAAASTGSAAAQDRGPVRTYSTPVTPPLRTALFDPLLFSGPEKGTAFGLTRAAGAGYVRIVANWRSIAPPLPLPGFVAGNPASPGYAWTSLDGMVAAAEAAGLTPIVDVGSAPKWALAPAVAGLDPVTPTAAALGSFATAIATHYDGRHGAPPVHVFQAWNEPNVSLYLAPVTPAVYRDMVNAFADAVHAVSPANVVIAGGLDPFGHPRRAGMSWYSTAPLAFMRDLLCLSKGSQPHATCGSAVHFDVWSHHPYTFGGAFGHATHPGDVELGDLPRMRALLQAAVRLHHVVSAQPVQFWVDEFSWDTSPPRKGAAPLPLAGRWTAESLYQMWRSGVSLVTWFGVQDRPSPSPYQCGLYFLSPLAAARPKPVFTAFRFPFVAYLGKKGIRVWGRDATSGADVVTIELRRGARGPWRAVARVRTNSFGILQAKLRVEAKARDWVRAVAASGSDASLPFALDPPAAPHIGPWGS
jgi:hypothetical protein